MGCENGNNVLLIGIDCYKFLNLCIYILNGHTMTQSFLHLGTDIKQFEMCTKMYWVGHSLKHLLTKKSCLNKKCPQCPSAWKWLHKFSYNLTMQYCEVIRVDYADLYLLAEIFYKGVEMDLTEPICSMILRYILLNCYLCLLYKEDFQSEILEKRGKHNFRYFQLTSRRVYYFVLLRRTIFLNIWQSLEF